MRRSIYGIFLFICLVAPVATTFLILKHLKKHVKREVKWRMIAGIDTSELVLLKFTEKEKRTRLNWKHSKEFEFNGEMYDIVKAVPMGDTTYYWCWWDHEETKLNRQLDDLVSFAFGKNAKQQENQKRLIQLFKSLYVTEPFQSSLIVAHHSSGYTIFKVNFYQSVFNSPLVPPPEVS